MDRSAAEPVAPHAASIRRPLDSVFRNPSRMGTIDSKSAGRLARTRGLIADHRPAWRLATAPDPPDLRKLADGRFSAGLAHVAYLPGGCVLSGRTAVGHRLSLAWARSSVAAAQRRGTLELVSLGRVAGCASLLSPVIDMSLPRR